MAVLTQNIESDPRATLLIVQPSSDGNPLGAGRVSLIGDITRVEDAERGAVRDVYLQSNPSASYWVDFGDFAFYRMDIADIYFVGGFGVMGWVRAVDYQAAAPDPLGPSSADIVQHMNEDHVETMILLAAKHAGLEATDAQMTGVDRLGFNLRLQTDAGAKGARIAFAEQAHTPDQVRAQLVAMAKAARAGTL